MEKYELRRIDDDTVEYYLNNVKVFEHYKDSNGYEWWKEYDENGNEIHYKNSDGTEKWYEYDENGNDIHYKNSKGDGHESWSEYDENNNLIYYKNSDGYEWGKNNTKNKEPEYKEPFTF